MEKKKSLFINKLTKKAPLPCPEPITHLFINNQ